MILHFGDESAEEQRFEVKGVGMGEKILIGQRGRHEQSAAHPPGQKPHDHLESVFLRQVGGFAETGDHDRIQAEVPQSLFGKGRAVGHDQFHMGAGAAAGPADRLEIGPQRKQAYGIHAGFLQSGEIFFDRVLRPVAPHADSRVAGPVVASDQELLCAR